MKKIAVIYKSVYGSTKKYAEWLAEDLDADLYERRSINVKLLASYDTVIYGGGLYAGGIAGVDLVSNNPCNRLVVFTVGLSNPETTDYSPTLKRNFSPDTLEGIKVFHLRGGIDYSRLKFIHKSMIAGLNKFLLDRKPQETLTEDEKMIRETYGQAVDFTNRAAIAPIVEYVNGLHV